MNTILEVAQLKKSFGGLHVLRDINFDLNENEIIGLIGPNGCGKSTTFNILAGNLDADNGSIKLYNQELIDLPPYQRNLLGLSRTYQNTRLWRNLTVIENLMVTPKNQIGARSLPSLFKRKAFRKQEKDLLDKAYSTLEFLEITHMANNLTSELSGGQSKLVDLARVLMSDPKVLMLDEPVAGVAPPLAEKIFQKVREMREQLNISVIIIEHNMDFILRKGVDRIFVMAAGVVIAKGRPDEIKEMSSVIEAYLGE
ncbi:MAG: ABC transporter ATP-binding protein [Candidatus Heimdallarchaeota archaeon]|nr:ABC transporter ATP-binding protein [Candidatus Heimdallarchaeota archaeon]MDH5647637.1 ABC transporter ATP-binding protein [Candidatus Heimdallarchaeota archaeon]